MLQMKVINAKNIETGNMILTPNKPTNQPTNQPWSGVLTGPQPVKKFPAFYGTRKFITAFTRARHMSLS